MTAMWLKWAWVHGTLDVEEFDSLGDAIGAAWGASEMGSESFAFIEGPDGVVPDEQVRAEWDRLDEASAQEYREAPKNTHAVRVKTPDGEREAWAGAFADESRARTHAEALRAIVGAQRVRVVSLPFRPGA